MLARSKIISYLIISYFKIFLHKKKDNSEIVDVGTKTQLCENIKSANV